MNEVIQTQICRRYDVPLKKAEADSIFGFALKSGSIDEPLHGLRHKPIEGTSGWYIWRGEYSDAGDFFSPLHIKHASERCPESIPYLGLPEGWRFLVKGEYADVWFDETLLTGESL